MKSVKFIIGCLILLMVACQQQEMVESMEEPAELTLKLVVPNNASRGNVSDNPTNTTGWTEAEKVIDGRYLYAVSVYLVDADKKVVACEEVTVDNQATEVVVEFDKSSELKRGIYTLMAVANHKDFEIDGTNYQSGLSTAWGTIGEGASADVLLNKTIDSSSDYISPKDVIQPLSLMKEVELHAGHNEVEGELVRTFARLRIEVKNNSGTENLKVNDLTFSDNFSQKFAYVFDQGMYDFETGAPNVASPKTLQPFSVDEGKNFKTIQAQQSAVVFDSYLLESKAQSGKNYTYTLNLSYDAFSNVFRIGKELNKVDEIARSDYKNCCFLIQNVKNKRFMCVEYSNLVSSPCSLNELKTLLETEDEAADKYLWYLEATDQANCYCIKNKSTFDYIRMLTTWGVSLDQNIIHPFRFFSNSDLGIQMQSKGEIELYICDWGSWYGGMDALVDESNFVFYAVDNKLGYSSPIVLTAIDPISQQSSPVTAIKRNYFINVLVTVSYNPVAGKFEFVVEDWNQGGGSVEFN